MSEPNKTQLYSDAVQNRPGYQSYNTITIKSTPSNTAPPTSLESTSTNIVSPQPQSQAFSPLPRVSDATFRSKWNIRPLTNNCAVTFESQPGTKQIEYIEAVSTYIEPTKIVSIGKNNDGRMCIVLIDEQSANEVITKGIDINGTYLPALPVYIKPVRVMISQIPSQIPDQDIVNYLTQFGKAITWLRPIPINSNNNPLFQHILSHRREIYLQMNDESQLPSKIRIIYDDVTYVLLLETEYTCYKCKNTGHMTRSCPLNFPANNRGGPVTDRLNFCSACKIAGHKLSECKANKPNNETSHVTPPDSLLTSNTSQMSNLSSQEQVNQQPNLVFPYSSQQTLEGESSSQLTSQEPSQVQSKTKRISHSNNGDEEIHKKITKTNRFDALQVNDDSDSEMSFETSSNSSDQFVVDDDTAITVLPLTTLQNILKETHYKKSSRVIKKVIVQYTEDYRSLVSDFKLLREHVLLTSPNPTNICQRIDRLLPKLALLMA